MIKLALKGLAENVYRFKGKGGETQDVITEMLEEIARDAQREIQTDTPVLSGQAKEAVEIRIDFGGDVRTAVSVFANLDVAPHWEFIEYGSISHEIERSGPDSALMFEGDGDEVFASIINHPGSPAQYIFKNATDWWRDRVDVYAEKLADDIAKIYE